MRKFLCVALGGFLAFSAVACNRESGGEKVDTSKTQLYIGALNSGISIEHLEQTAKEFEEFYKERSFEDDKKGVQVIIDPGQIGDFEGEQVFNKIANSRDALFYTQAVDYYKFVNAGLLADITTEVRADLSAYGDGNGVTIESKMDKQQRDFLAVDGKYYAVPWYNAFYGMYYDVDLFEREGFYFAKGQTADDMDLTDDQIDLSGLFVFDKEDERSYGPDGKTGVDEATGIDYSMDDGLPATFQDFFALTLYMSTCGVDPLIWNGKLFYLSSFVLACAVNEMGKEGTLANLDYSGQVSDLVKEVTVDSKGNASYTYYEPQTITKENGYMLSRQQGKFDALAFWERLVGSEHNYSSMSFSSSLTHTGAQDEFLYSSAMSSKKDIGMIIEGSWLNAEATVTMADMEINDGEQYSQQNRRIGIMPFPWSSRDKVGSKQTALGTSDSYIFMNANAKGVTADVAKLFLQFANTDRQLINFTKLTGVTRGIRTNKITAEDLNSMNYYAKSMLNYQNGANLVFPVSTQGFVLNNWSDLKIDAWTWYADVNGAQTRDFTYDFRDGTRTAKAHFDGMYAYAEKNWSKYTN